MKLLRNNLIDKLKSNNPKDIEDSFNIIYNEYSYLVYYISLKILKDTDLAKEVTNETFMNFYMNKENISSYKNIKYYLTVTCKNLSLNNLSKLNRYEQLNDNISYEIKNDDYQTYIDKFKEFLSEDELELIVLHLIYGFTFKEISYEKNLSINIISSKYNRTIKKIRKYYKEEKYV